jgi:hypothetical protein
MSVKHWQDPTNLALGLWMLASPWALGFQGERLATNSALALGVLVSAVALFALFRVMAWQEWANIAFGVWLVASPWIIGFSELSMAKWNAVIVGALIAVLALWVIATDRDIGGWWHPATEGK